MRPKSFSIRVGERDIEVSWKALEVLRIIRAKGSIKAASEELGLSYRNVIRIVRMLEKEVGGETHYNEKGKRC